MSQLVNDEVKAEYVEKTIAISIWKYSSPILIFLGTIGNILSIVVLTRKTFRHSTTSVYFIALAISDTLVLYSGLLRWWILYQFELDIRHIHPVICKLHTPLVTFSLQCSSWVLIAVTVERFISVFSPHTIRQRCTKTTATVAISLIVLMLGVLNFHFIFGLGDYVLVDDDNVTVTYPCDSITDQYYVFNIEVWPWIDLTFYCLIPFIILTILNFLILYYVIENGKKRRTLVYSSSTGSIRCQSRTSGKISSLVTTLFLINIVYFVCTTPISVFMICRTFWVEEHGTRLAAIRSLIFAIVNQFQYVNNVSNFVLYCLSGTRFRDELKSLFCMKVRQDANVRSVRITDSNTSENSTAISLVQVTATGNS